MNILAVGCHPDDLEVGCGGTLAKYVSLGHKVFMCHVASGNVGHRILTPDELTKIRDKEAKKAAEVIGAEAINLFADDLFVRSDNMELRKKLVDVIRYTKPDLIITHPLDDYMDDHEETSRLVFEASMAATVNHFHTEHEYYERITPIYYMEPSFGVGILPEEYVDITDFIKIKTEALSKHESQIKWLKDHDEMDILDNMRVMARFRGLQCEVGYAECFTQMKKYHKLTTKRLLP